MPHKRNAFQNCIEPFLNTIQGELQMKPWSLPMADTSALLKALTLQTCL
jgi:hypothetical protein